MDQVTTITDPLVKMFGKIRAEIQIAIRNSDADTPLRRGLIKRQAQVARSWWEFQNG